ncbi:MAG: zinc-dependent metalloprotease [Methylococcales bacterium]|nr:zinc-dependent metalloprotease [Methylococcales bacterium]
MKQRCADNGINFEQCIQFTAVHEFGHVLGLSHEHNRDFSFNSCSLDDPARYNVKGNTSFTDYDPDSIMNYCRQNYYGDKSLSLMDKISVKAYYGRIPTFTDETSKLDIPRVMFQGNPYKATLQLGSDGKFTLISMAPTNNLPENQSSIETTFSNSILTLPLLRYMKNRKVMKLWKGTLRQGSDGKFYRINIDVHPDAKV